MTQPPSERGRLLPPDLDDRRWQELVDEAVGLIPKYAPQWTDHNPGDIGITLVELFAWLVEGLIYKLNRVPEKNYVAFLDLLGITRDPQLPARTLLTFTPRPGSTVAVPRGTLAQTQPSEANPPLAVETEDELTVAPVTVETAVRVDLPAAGAASYTAVSAAMVPPAVGATTVALAAGATAQLCLGFARAATELDLYVEVAGWAPPEGRLGVRWVYSTAAATDPATWPEVTLRADRSAALRRDGLVRVTVPTAPSWVAQAPSSWPVGPTSDTAPITERSRWLGLRLTNESGAPLRVDLARLLLNTVPATASRSAGPEELGTGDGTAFQVLRLRNRPLLRRPGTDTPYDHLTVTVDGTPWTLVDDLEAGAGRQYRLDPVAGEISFGNHDPGSGRGHGAIPAAGNVIRASYRHVAAGAAGNVPRDTISALAAPVPGILGVHNPVPGTGGADEEPIEQTKARAPELLRKRNRAVTAEDYEFLARQVAPGAVVRCLPPRLQDEDNLPAWRKGDPWRFGALSRSPGNVNLVLVPDLGPDVARPRPAPALVQDVLVLLERRSDVTAHLHIAGPRYLPIKVEVHARIFQRAIDEGRIRSVLEANQGIASAVTRFLHPTRGGRERRGWAVGESVFLADVYQAVRPPDDVGYIESLTLEPQVPDYHDPGRPWNPAERPLLLTPPGPLVRVADYELVCFGASNVPERPPE